MILKQRWERNKESKMKIMEVEGKRNKDLMAKVLKGLLGIVYSTKLYSKRCDYLQKKHNSSLKNHILIFWNETTKEKKKTFQILKEKIKLSILPLMNFYLKVGFRALSEENDRICSKEK